MTPLASKAKNQIFLALADEKAEEVEARLTEKKIPFFQFKTSAWFISFAGTATEAAEAIGLRSTEPITPGVVVSINNYGGKANPDLWEWLRINWPSDG